MTRRDVGAIAAIIAVWTAAIVIVDPRGDFPLHDDWVYGVSTWDFVHSGHFHFPVVTTVSLRAQVLWGALWTCLFGESFNVLRASTLVLSLLTLILVQRILVRAGVPQWASVLGALALLFSPPFLWSSCTFMTDVPYLFTSVVAFYFFTRGISEERVLPIVAGSAAVVVSWFIRQNGVVNLFPPLALLLYARPRRWRALAAPIVACGFVFGLLLLFRREWLSGSPQWFVVHYHMWLESSFGPLDHVSLLFHYIGFNAVNCAVFFLPLTLPLLTYRNRSRWALSLLAGITLLLGFRTAWLAWSGYLVPYSARNFSDILPGPLFIDFGVGPPNLMDTWDGHAPYPFTMPHAARLVLTFGAGLLAILLIWALATARGAGVLKLAVLSAAFGTLMLAASGLYFDRYSLDSAWAIVVALPLVIPWHRPAARALAIGALVAMAFFSTLAVQEHFTWNRARWTAYRELRSKGIAGDQIDGGAEASGLYELRDASISEVRRPHPLRPYAITFRPLDGFQVVARYPFTSFLGMRHGAIYVLERLKVSGPGV